MGHPDLEGTAMPKSSHVTIVLCHYVPTPHGRIKLVWQNLIGTWGWLWNIESLWILGNDFFTLLRCLGIVIFNVELNFGGIPLMLNKVSELCLARYNEYIMIVWLVGMRYM